MSMEGKAVLKADASDFGKKIDGAKEKVKTLDQQVVGFSRSLTTLKSAVGITFGVGAIMQMAASIKDVMSMAKDGIQIVSNEQLANMKSINALVEDMGNKLKGAGAIASTYLLGGLVVIGNVMKEMFTGDMANAWENTAKKMNATLSNEQKKNISENTKKGTAIKEETANVGLTSQQLLAKEKEKLKAMEQGRDANKSFSDVYGMTADSAEYLSNVELKILESNKKISELKEKVKSDAETAAKYMESETEKYKTEQKKIREEINKQNKERQDKINDYKKGEEEIADIRAKGALVGATLEEKIAANKEEQLKTQKEIARSGGKENQDKRKELENLKVSEKELQKDVKERNKKAGEIRSKGAEDIAKLSTPKGKEVSSAALGGASKGMYLGGTDRSNVAIKSKAESIAEKTKDILVEMNKSLKELAEG